MFGLFEGRRNSFLGVDFGTSSIKIVELKLRNQKPFLSNYGWVRLDFIQESGNDNIKADSYDEKLEEYLKALVEKIKPKSKNTYASIPGFNGLVTLIEFPKMKRSELNQAITFEAHKYIPTSLEEVSISWDIVSENGEGEKKGGMGSLGKKKNKGPQKMQVLLVAAPKDKVIRYESIVKAAKLKVKAIELETFSITRSLVGDDAGAYAVVDIGFRVCSIVIVEKGIVRVSRNIDVGGNDITNSISENLNISKQRAEAMKKQDKDFINGKEAVIVLPTLDLIINEVARTIEAYEKKNMKNKIDGLILSGGTAKLKGINNYFSKRLNIKSIIGDPWKKITYDEKIEPIIKKLGTSFSVALGLALRGIEEYRKN